jgi:hypothetical protein
MSALHADDDLMTRFLNLKMRPGGPRILGSDGLLRLSAEALLAGF